VGGVLGSLLVLATLPLAAFIAWRSSGMIRIGSRSSVALKVGVLGGRLLVSVILFFFAEVLLLWLLLVAKGLFGG
jgi:hypothetical protein